MNASIVELRYKTNDILAALEHGERVTILYRGRPRATIVPLTDRSRLRVAEHPFFGMSEDGGESVEDTLARLRGPRHAR